MFYLSLGLPSNPDYSHPPGEVRYGASLGLNRPLLPFSLTPVVNVGRTSLRFSSSADTPASLLSSARSHCRILTIPKHHETTQKEDFLAMGCEAASATKFPALPSATRLGLGLLDRRRGKLHPLAEYYFGRSQDLQVA